MILWIIVGLIVWILCFVFMLAILKGGHRIRGLGYRQKLYLRSMVNTQNVKDSIKKELKKHTRTRTNQCLPISYIVF
ncbi:MAG: hypothetical protein ACYSTS_06640 [Planctomycetota bacterium]|jgi:hypothetical protein